MYKFKPCRLLLITCIGLQLSGLHVNKLDAHELRTQRNDENPSPPVSPAPPSILPSVTLQSCPSDVKALTTLLLRDLPSYANRVIQRSRRLDRTVDTFSYVLVAGNPEFEPLTLGPGGYSNPASVANAEPPQQVFLTTLERQYNRGKAIYTQHYHWLFLTQTSDGWRLALMFSRIGSSSGERPPTPPRESSDGTIGQAVKIWLRDCRAGAIRAS